MEVLQKSTFLQDYKEEQHHRRRLTLLRLGLTWSASLGAGALGTWLTTHGYDLPGFFLIGGALAATAPEYVENFVRLYFGYLRRIFRKRRGASEGAGEEENGDSSADDERA